MTTPQRRVAGTGRGNRGSHAPRWILGALLAACVALGSCSSDPVNILEEASSMLKECKVSDEETYGIDVNAWTYEVLVREDFGILFPCVELRRSLARWRDCYGMEWAFLNNPSREGSVSENEQIRAVGLQYSDDDVSRTLVVNLTVGELGYVDGRAELGHLDQRRPPPHQPHPRWKWLDDSQVEAASTAVGDAVSSWTSTPGWPGDIEEPPLGSDWVNMEGWDWTVVVCAGDYSLYRYAGSGAGPPELEDLIDALWGLT